MKPHALATEGEQPSPAQAADVTRRTWRRSRPLKARPSGSSRSGSPPRSSWPTTPNSPRCSRRTGATCRPRSCWTATAGRPALRHPLAPRPRGRARARPAQPAGRDAAEHRDDGWCGGHSVIEIVTDDMPFLVDSVTAELARHDIGIHLLVHPQLVVRREVLGKLDEVRCALDPDVGVPEGELVESWMHIEIDRQADPRRAGAAAQRPAAGSSPTSARPSRTGRRCAARPSRSPTSWPRPSCRCRTRTSRTPVSCCAGWRTTTSRSSATASTPLRRGGERVAWPCWAAASASCAATSRTRAAWARCRRRSRGRRPWNSGC